MRMAFCSFGRAMCAMMKDTVLHPYVVVVTRRAQGRWLVKYPEALGLESTCVVSPSMRTKDGNPMCGDLKLHSLATSWTSHQGAIFCIAIPDLESQEEIDREGELLLECRTSAILNGCIMHHLKAPCTGVDSVLHAAPKKCDYAFM